MSPQHMFAQYQFLFNLCSYLALKFHSNGFFDILKLATSLIIIL